MSGSTEAFIVPAALLMNASSAQVGLLRAFPPLLTAIAQLFTERIVSFFNSRLKTLSTGCGAQATFLVLAGACLLLPENMRLYLFMAAIAGYYMSGNMNVPAWTSLVGEYLPASKRGRYLGFRNSLVGWCYAAAGFGAVWLLSHIGGHGLYGFLALFLLAAGFRYGSVFCMRFVRDVPLSRDTPSSTDFRGFIKGFRTSGVIAFTLSCALMNFAVYLVAPFFAIYILKGLGCNYWQYILLVTVGPLTTYTMMRRWGVVGDSVGSLTVLRISMVMMPFITLFWASTRNIWLLSLTETFSGLSWAAYYIGTNNYLLEAAPASMRVRAVSYFGILIGVAQASGTLLGGYLYDRVPAVSGQTFIFMLLVSAALRVFALAVFFSKVKPARGGKRMRHMDMLLVFFGLRQA